MNYEELINILLPLILTAMGAIFTMLGTEIAIKVKKFLDSKEKRSIAEATVKYVEQIGKALGSDEKFALAKKTIVEELNNAGIKVTELELTVLIEATVNGFKKEYAKEDIITEELQAIVEAPIMINEAILDEPVGTE